MDRKQIMTVLISHFGKQETNMKLQIIADEIIKAQPATTSHLEKGYLIKL